LAFPPFFCYLSDILIPITETAFMQQYFTPEYQWLWTIGLTAALFFPLRQMIWVLSVRRAEAKEGGADEARKRRLKNRAAVTSALLSFVFALIYVNQLFKAP